MLRKTAKKRRQKANNDDNGFEQWGGYMNAKISKLEAQFEEDQFFVGQKDERLSEIFKGISIFVNGYTEPSADELRCLMLQHGGVYHHYYRSGKTTHIIASVLPNAKFNQMKHLKVVKCEWITESIKAGRLLDYKNFLLLNDFPNSTKGENLLLKFAKKEVVPSTKETEIPKTAADDGYLTEFYSNSRLHHISALGAMLKQYVQELREKHNGIFPGRALLLENQQIISDLNIFDDRNVIIHIDMDCFFVSVALRNHPELKGQPVAVTHSKGGKVYNNTNSDRKFEAEFYKKKMLPKIQSQDSSDEDYIEKWSNEKSSMSEISSCSYEARAAGVTKGMYLGVALKLCPNLKTVPYDFNGYKEVSMCLYNTVAEYTLDIEAISCDELIIDCSGLLADLQINPMVLVEVLRQQILEKTGCTASAGVGSNKLQARLATIRAKPNGQFYLTPDMVNEFMKNLSINDLPGVGRTTSARLKILNIKTCGDLQNLSLKTLQKEFGGKIGETLYKYCRGIDDRKVNFIHERKSVSAEVNYGIRFNDNEETETFLKQLSEEVAKRLRDIKMMGKNITFKVMFRAKDAPVETAKFLGHGVCDQINRSVTLSMASNDSNIIAKQVISLYHQLGIPPNDLRGLGIQITKLEPTHKVSKTLQTYFTANESSKEKKQTAIDSNKKETNPVKLPTASEIDPEVLASLPDDIRQEIIKEYGLENVIQETVKKGVDEATKNPPLRQIDADEATKDPPPRQIDADEATKDPPPRQIDADEAAKTIFNLSLSDMRLMIKEWVAAEHIPQTYDVQMLNSYLSKLIERKNLENVSIIIKCLHRHINNRQTNIEIWRTTYKHIVDCLQNSMLDTFGKPLAVESF